MADLETPAEWVANRRFDVTRENFVVTTILKNGLKSRRKIIAYEEFDRNSSAAAKFLDEGNSCLPDASWIDDFQVLASVESVDFQLVLGGAFKIARIGWFSLEIVDDVALPISLVEKFFTMLERR